MANQLGAYQIIEEIGRGGMGTVYRAMDTRLQRPVALKVLSGDLESEAVMIERFQREARALARVRHPNLINIYNVDRHGGTHYFAMELINGHPVSDLTREENGLPIEEVLDIVEQVLPALSAIHRVGLVHRDIKPGNIMVDEKGRAILMDFGLVKGSSDATITETSVVVGTPHYMSPEQARQVKLDGRSDIYSLGVVLFQMLSGKLPFTGKSAIRILQKHVSEPPPKLSELVEDFPVSLDTIVQKLLQKNPDARFQTAEQASKALDRFKMSFGLKTEAPKTSVPDAAAPNLKAVAGADATINLGDEDYITETAAPSPMAGKPSRGAEARRRSDFRRNLLFAFLGGMALCALMVIIIIGYLNLTKKKETPPPEKSFGSLPNLFAEQIVIRQGTEPTRIEVVARLPSTVSEELAEGLLSREEGERILRFVLLNEDGREGPSILGKYVRKGDELVFSPRYRLSHGKRYRATFHVKGRSTLATEYQLPPRKPTLPASVEKIYPSASKLPANLLKFYIYFSKPMREGKEVFDHIRLLNHQGKSIPHPWRRVELWTADARRLTLWIHPGRIKQGVNLRRDFGPVLRPKEKYSLVIGPDLRDKDGQPLGKEFRKTFTAGPEDRVRPLPSKWKIELPESGTRRALVVKFPEPLDSALVVRHIRIVGPGGKRIDGKVEVGLDEKSRAFRPDAPWIKAPYTLAVDPLLEDLAGNSPVRLFDTDLSRPAPKRPKLIIPFRPR